MKQRDIEHPEDRIKKSKNTIKLTSDGKIKKEYLNKWQRFIRLLKFWEW